MIGLIIMVAVVVLLTYTLYKRATKTTHVDTVAVEQEIEATLHESTPQTEVTASMVALETKPTVIVDNKEVEVVKPTTMKPKKKKKPANKGNNNAPKPQAPKKK
jgi:hypothetical protein